LHAQATFFGDALHACQPRLAEALEPGLVRHDHANVGVAALRQVARRARADAGADLGDQRGHQR